ncbi:MAG: peptide chain release factor N(5)-glutamine methyltransferase [Micrococcales bacterium]|nr:peptide chain release factor N(5)-glutamine methyltransferase [Micrococcales bacterium]
MSEVPRAGYALASALREATTRLQAAGIDNGRSDAVTLAAHLLRSGCGEVERLAILGAPTPTGFDDLVARRAQRVPLQHLTGRAAFRHLELSVGPGVFVPRPETEVLVDLALLALDALRAATAASRPGSGPARLVDLCTGSGAIALSVAHERPATRVFAVELSAQAHAFARANADRLGLDIDLRQGDATTAFDDLLGRVDVVVTNPPYIPDGAVPIDPEVAGHDPAVALYGGGDGLELPMRLIERAALLLRPGGVLLVEHGELQGGDLRARLQPSDPRDLSQTPAAQSGYGAATTWQDVHDHRDLTGRPRVLRAVRAREIMERTAGEQDSGGLADEGASSTRAAAAETC